MTTSSQFFGRGGQRVGSAGGDDDARTAGNKRFGDGFSQPARPTRHHYHFAVPESAQDFTFSQAASLGSVRTNITTPAPLVKPR
jgi:hypothetical protein